MTIRLAICPQCRHYSLSLQPATIFYLSSMELNRTLASHGSEGYFEKPLGFGFIVGV